MEGERKMAELSASLLAEHQAAIASIKKAIGAAKLCEEMSDDMQNILVGALNTMLTELKNIDPASLTDVTSVDAVARRIRSIASGG